jgi:hypothetical protein
VVKITESSKLNKTKNKKGLVVVVANPRRSAEPNRVHEDHGWGERAASVVTRIGAPEVED